MMNGEQVVLYMTLQDENHEADGWAATGDLPRDAGDEVDGDGDVAVTGLPADSMAAALRALRTGVDVVGEVTFRAARGFLADESTASLFRFLAVEATVGVAFAFVVLLVGVRDRERGRPGLREEAGVAFGDLTVTLRVDAGVLGVFGGAFLAERAGVFAILDPKTTCMRGVNDVA